MVGMKTLAKDQSHTITTVIAFCNVEKSFGVSRKLIVPSCFLGVAFLESKVT